MNRVERFAQTESGLSLPPRLVPRDLGDSDLSTVVTRPVAYDFYCGRGGWTNGLLAAGYRVIGFDIVRHPEYCGEFRLRDARGVTAAEIADAALLVFSPMCEEFSRWSMPWTRAKNPPPPNCEFFNHSMALGASMRVPFVVENVRGAQAFVGRAQKHFGPFYLWGTGIPPLLPEYHAKKKESYGGKDRAKRAEIPFDLAYSVGVFNFPRLAEGVQSFKDGKTGQQKTGASNASAQRF